MPFVKISTDLKFDAEQKKEFASKVSRAITKIVGKSENAMMVEISDESYFYFRGKESNGVIFIDIKLSGENDFEEKKLYTQELFEIFGDVVGAKNIFVTINEYDHWGSGGTLNRR